MTDGHVVRFADGCAVYTRDYSPLHDAMCDAWLTAYGYTWIEDVTFKIVAMAAVAPGGCVWRLVRVAAEGAA